MLITRGDFLGNMKSSDWKDILIDLRLIKKLSIFKIGLRNLGLRPVIHRKCISRIQMEEQHWSLQQEDKGFACFPKGLVMQKFSCSLEHYNNIKPIILIMLRELQKNDLEWCLENCYLRKFLVCLGVNNW